MIKTDVNECKHVIYGHGTVGVWSKTNANLGKLYIAQIPMIPIGKQELCTGDEVPEVILSFCNINSVDIMIKQLQKIKSELEGN